MPEDFRPGFLYPSLVWPHFIQGKRIRDGSGLMNSGPSPSLALRGQIGAEGAVGLQGGQYCCSVLQFSAYAELSDRVSQRFCSLGLEGTDRALCLLFHKSWVITSWPQSPLWSHRCPALRELRSHMPCTARWARSHCFQGRTCTNTRTRGVQEHPTVAPVKLWVKYPLH